MQLVQEEEAGRDNEYDACQQARTCGSRAGECEVGIRSRRGRCPCEWLSPEGGVGQSLRAEAARYSGGVVFHVSGARQRGINGMNEQDVPDAGAVCSSSIVNLRSTTSTSRANRRCGRSSRTSKCRAAWTEVDVRVEIFDVRSSVAVWSTFDITRWSGRHDAKQE